MVFLLAAAAEFGDSFAPYAAGGGSAAAVAGLVYMARKLTNGELVAFPVKQRDEELVRLITDAKQREDTVKHLLQQQVEASQRVAKLQEETNRIIGRWSNMIEETGK